MIAGIETPPFPDRVLVVDDEEVVLQVFDKLLKGVGLGVVTSRTGEEAISFLEKEQFGCLLVDKNLPALDGIEVIRAARKLQPFCACIVITAYSSTASALEALRLGAKDYLEKPFDDLDLLAHKLKTVLHAQRTEYERHVFLERIRAFEMELKAKDEKVASQQSEIDMFNRVLELRVSQATEDLKRKTSLLESCLRSTKNVDTAIAMHTESLLEYVRGLSFDDRAPAAMARAAMTRIARQLESNLSLIRTAQQAADRSGRKEP